MKKKTNAKTAKAIMLVTKAMATVGCHSASGWSFHQPKVPKNPYKSR